MVIAERRVQTDQISVQIPVEEKYAGVKAGLREFLQRVDREKNPDGMSFPMKATDAKQSLAGFSTFLAPDAIDRFVSTRNKANYIGLDPIKEKGKVVDYEFKTADQYRILCTLFYVVENLGKRPNEHYVRPNTKDVIETAINWLGTNPLASGIKNPYAGAQTTRVK